MNEYNIFTLALQPPWPLLNIIALHLPGVLEDICCICVLTVVLLSYSYCHTIDV